jgi:hypothetical protein
MLLLHYIEQIYGPNSKGQHSIYEGILLLIMHYGLFIIIPDPPSHGFHILDIFGTNP